MIPCLYASMEKKFDNNGIGKMADAHSCVVTEKRNGSFELEMVYPADGIHADQLEEGNIILAKPSDTGRSQPFRIYKIATPIDGKLTVKARHISYQLNFITVSPFATTSCTGALAGLGNHAASECPFEVWTDMVYVNIMFNSDLKRLVVKGCNENDRDALRWCIAKPDKRKSRKMSCRLFSELLYKEMDWSGDCRYKILGYRIEFEGEALYVFDLVAAEVFHECKKKQSADQQPTTVAEENTEEQPVNPRKGYYPDDIAGTFGMPVEQHRQESELRQMDGFVSVGMLTGMPGQQQNL